MGFGDFVSEIENAADGQTSAQQQTQDSSDSKYDTVIDSGPVVDGFASKEGLPAAADPVLNNFVNDEVNKFI